jgi:hypothetical protein
MDFTCCNTCGTAEIDDQRTPLATDQGYPFREWAYTFFHQQDADSLADEPATLFLTYSSWRAAPDTDPLLLAAAKAGDVAARAQVAAQTNTQVGQVIAAALRDQGLTVDWDGDPRQRIAVTIEHWRKPLPS